MKFKPSPISFDSRNTGHNNSPAAQMLIQTQASSRLPAMHVEKYAFQQSRRVVMTSDCLKGSGPGHHLKVSGKAKSLSSTGSGSESPIDEDVLLSRSHSSPSSSLDSDIGSDNPDECEMLLRSNPGAGGLFDESNIRRVNLNAAFHDHISLTKLNRQLSHTNANVSFPFLSSHHLAASDHASSPSPNPEKEQIQLLQNMVVTQLDLIEYQKEQLQKKDRQLLGLKHDRENVLNRYERLEKRCNLLAKKLSLVCCEKCGHSSVTPSGTECGDVIPKSSKLMTSASTAGRPIVLDDVLPNVTKSSSSSTSCTAFTASPKQQQLQQPKVGLNRDLIFKEQATQVNADMIRRSKANTSYHAFSSSKKKKLSQITNQSSLQSFTGKSLSESDHQSSSQQSVNQLQQQQQTPSQQPARKKQRSASIPVRIIEDSDVDVCETVAPEPAPEPITILLPKDFLTTDEEYEIVNMREMDAPRLKRPIDVLTPDCDTSSSISGGCGTSTRSLKSISIDNAPLFTENGINRIKSTNELIEVPSFRILNFSPLPTLPQQEQQQEMLDDETFNRRHAKLEIDERRRKRWDMQRLREQKHNERLKQGKYYSSCAFVHPDAKIGSTTTDLKPDSVMLSFFPDPMDAQMLEINDKIPVLAFGHPIPRLRPCFFSLPWNKKVTLTPVPDAEVSDQKSTPK